MRCHHYCNESLRCPECVRRFWRWAEMHTRGRSKRAARRVPTARSFYECAADHVPAA